MSYVLLVVGFFFFVFCKQKTAYEMRISDWSSDVCSSDLRADIGIGAHRSNRDLLAGGLRRQRVERLHLGAAIDAVRTKPHRDAARDRVDGIGLEGRDRGEAHAVERCTVRSVGEPADHAIVAEEMRDAPIAEDRKSTRLNSSH